MTYNGAVRVLLSDEVVHKGNRLIVATLLGVEERRVTLTIVSAQSAIDAHRKVACVDRLVAILLRQRGVVANVVGDLVDDLRMALSAT